MNVFMKKKLLFFLYICFFSFAGLAVKAQQADITVRKDAQHQKIDIVIDGKLFTSFQYPSNYEKPFLYPVYSPDGAIITRGYPMAPRKGERVDHPHHIGLWFNHGNVNGLDFWNNSSAIKDKEKYGHIVVTKILNVKSGKQGWIKVVSEWRDQKENVLLEEATEYIITATENTRTIDHISTLKAVQDVTFADNKEGMIAIRVDRAFEKPTNETLTFTDEHGNPTKVKAQTDNTGVNGMYYSSGGYTGDDVWSTRNDWVLLTGEKNGSIITFGFFDHPKNVGYPFHSHARGYGLFASNNLGSQSYNKNDEKITVKIEKDNSLILRHRFYLESGKKVTKEKANTIFSAFSQKY